MEIDHNCFRLYPNNSMVALGGKAELKSWVGFSNISSSNRGVLHGVLQTLTGQTPSAALPVRFYFIV